MGVSAEAFALHALGGGHELLLGCVAVVRGAMEDGSVVPIRIATFG